MHWQKPKGAPHKRKRGQNATQAPGAEITRINKETRGGQVLYIFTFEDEIHHPRLYIGADGKVIHQSLPR